MCLWWRRRRRKFQQEKTSGFKGLLSGATRHNLPVKRGQAIIEL
jgi:hypothetical protein